MRRILLILMLGFVPGCAVLDGSARPGEAGAGMPAAALEGQQRPLARPEGLDTTPAPVPSSTARTVEQFDTTTAEDRAEALTPVQSGGEQRLGTTIASLGSPTDPGIWIKTPLVTTVTQGRVVYTATGKSVNVELRPSGGAPGSGSQISLAAMRLLEAPLTGLPELEVFAF